VIERVQEYRYLGQLTSFANKTEKELKVRRGNAWKAFWAQKQNFKSKMSLATKIPIFESTVIPVLLYGAQSWALTAKQQKKIQVTQNAMIRSILGIKLSDKVSNEEIYKKSGVIARTLKFKYAGHVVREDKTKWNKILTMWTPHWAKRGRDRPSTRWSDELKKEIGTDWHGKATNRQNWRDLVRTYAQKWAVEDDNH